MKGKGKGSTKGPKSGGPVIGFASGAHKNPHSGMNAMMKKMGMKGK